MFALNSVARLVGLKSQDGAKMNGDECVILALPDEDGRYFVENIRDGGHYRILPHNLIFVKEIPEDSGNLVTSTMDEVYEEVLDAVSWTQDMIQSVSETVGENLREGVTQARLHFPEIDGEPPPPEPVLEPPLRRSRSDPIGLSSFSRPPTRPLIPTFGSRIRRYLNDFFTSAAQPADAPQEAPSRFSWFLRIHVPLQLLLVCAVCIATLPYILIPSPLDTFFTCLSVLLLSVIVFTKVGADIVDSLSMFPFSIFSGSRPAYVKGRKRKLTLILLWGVIIVLISHKINGKKG